MYSFFLDHFLCTKDERIWKTRGILCREEKEKAERLSTKTHGSLGVKGGKGGGRRSREEIQGQCSSEETGGRGGLWKNLRTE